MNLSFHARSDGYGAMGLAPHVPPEAKLEVEVELVNFKIVENVTEDGEVVRKIMGESSTASYKTPNEGAKVI